MRWIRYGDVAIVFLISSWMQAVTGVFKDFPLPTPNASPNAITADATGGIIYTEFAGNKIGRLAKDGSGAEYSIPTANAGPAGLTADLNGNLWFTEFLANKIGKVSPSGAIVEFSIPTPKSGPMGMAVDLSGTPWFTEFLAGKIGKITQDGLITEYSLTSSDSGPTSITLGDFDGLVMVFTEQNSNRIGRIHSDGTVIEAPVPTPSSRPMGITTDSQGITWITEFAGNKLGRVNQDFSVTEYPLPSLGSGPRGIAARAFAGEIWFTEELGSKIGRRSFDGTIVEFPIPTPDSHPTEITSATFSDDPYLWFAEQGGNKISRVIEDVLVLPIGGKASHWYTRLDLANTEPQSVSIFIGTKPVPVYDVFGPAPIALPPCAYQEIFLSLPPNGLVSDAQSACPFFSMAFVDARQTGVLPSARARIFNTANPSQVTDLPLTRLSRIAELDPQVLVFPTSAASGAEVNLFLSDVSQQDNLSVSLEAYSSDGQLLASTTASTPANSVMVLPMLSILGLEDLEGQIRVTKLSGSGWMWGTLITASPDGTLSAVLGANP